MSLKPSEVHFHLKLGPSYWLTLILLLLHLLAVVLVWVMPLPLIVQLSLTPLLVYSGYSSIRRYALLTHPRAINTIIINKGEWHVQLRNGSQYKAEFIDKYLSTYFVIITLSDNKRQLKPLSLFADMMQSEQWRQMKVHLRFSH